MPHLRRDETGLTAVRGYQTARSIRVIYPALYPPFITDQQVSRLRPTESDIRSDQPRHITATHRELWRSNGSRTRPVWVPLSLEPLFTKASGCGPREESP